MSLQGLSALTEASTIPVFLCKQGLRRALTWSPASYVMLEPLTSSSTCTQERSD